MECREWDLMEIGVCGGVRRVEKEIERREERGSNRCMECMEWGVVEEGREGEETEAGRGEMERREGER